MDFIFKAVAVPINTITQRDQEISFYLEKITNYRFL